MEYLTEAEVGRLITAAGLNRYGHRDATMILLAYRHGLRAAELVAMRWDSVDFAHGRLHVNRAEERLAKPSIPSPAESCGRCGGSSASRGRLALRVYVGAGRAVHTGGLPQDDRPARRRGRLRVPGSPAHAAPCLRLRAREQGRRYPLAAGLSRAQEHPAHGALHGAGPARFKDFWHD